MEKKVMSDYTCYCTKEQVKKAFELGAPIIELPFSIIMSQDTCDKYGMLYLNDKYYQIPTTEQMRVWLESQGFYFRTNTIGSSAEIDFICIYEDNSICYPEGILAVIDAALNYLSNK